MGSKDHACALILLLLDRRRYGFPSPMEDVVGPLGTIPDDAGVLSLEVLLPDAAQQQGYLAWLRDFEAEQVERPKFGESGDTTTELSRVWRVTYDVVVGGGGQPVQQKAESRVLMEQVTLSVWCRIHEWIQKRMIPLVTSLDYILAQFNPSAVLQQCGMNQTYKRV